MKTAIFIGAALAATSCQALDLSALMHDSEIRALGPAFSHHNGTRGALVRPCESPNCSQQELVDWNQQNSGLGVAVVKRSASGAAWTGHASYITDSYSQPSLMVGLSRTWSVLPNRYLQVDAGIDAGLWARSEQAKNLVDVRRTVVPYALPVLNLTDKKTGVGVSVAYAPAVKLNGHYLNYVSTLMVQTSFRVSKSRSFFLATEREGVNIAMQESF